MTTVERVRQAVQDSGNGDVPGDDQPLFYDRSLMSPEEHRARGGLSLDRLELTLRIEEEFSIEIPDAVATEPEFSTVAGIAAWVDANRLTAPFSGI
jgi:hypothetical protein